jgi:hypothetical protein
VVSRSAIGRAWLGIIRAARDAGLTPLEKVETNAFWATNDGLTRARLEQLNALGMEKLIVSSDVYHQEFIPLSGSNGVCGSHGRCWAAGRVMVRWWDFFNNPVDLRKATSAEKRDAYRRAILRHKERLTGRAAAMLSDLLDLYPAEHFKSARCKDEILRSDHVHIGP